MKLYRNNPASQNRACPEENLTPQASRHTYPLRNMTLVKPATKEGKHEGSQRSHQDRKYTHVRGKTMYVRRELKQRKLQSASFRFRFPDPPMTERVSGCRTFSTTRWS